MLLKVGDISNFLSLFTIRVGIIDVGGIYLFIYLSIFPEYHLSSVSPTHPNPPFDHTPIYSSYSSSTLVKPLLLKLKISFISVVVSLGGGDGLIRG